MEMSEQEQIETEQKEMEELHELALKVMEGIATGLIIAGECPPHLLHEGNEVRPERKLAMASALACFTSFAGREVMRNLYSLSADE